VGAPALNGRPLYRHGSMGLPRSRADVRPAVAVHGLFVTFGFVVAAFFPFLAIYLESRGLDPSRIGIVLAAMAVARLIVNPFLGHAADAKVGRLTALRFGALGTAIAAFTLNTVHGLVPIAVTAAAAAAFMVAIGPNIDAIALVHLGPERMSDYGRIRAWESLSYAGACLAFGAVMQAAGIGRAMPLFAVACLVVLLWSWTVVRDRPAPRERTGKLGSVGAVFREAPRFWGFLVALFFLWTGFNGAWNYIALKITSEGGGPLLVGIGTALGGLMEVPVMRVSSRLQQRFGLRKVFALGACVYATGFLLWGLISSPTIVSLLTILEGVGFALLFTTSVVVVGRLLPSSLYSTGNSVAQMVGFGIGPIVGGLTGGFVYQHLGPVMLYVGASCFALAGAIAAWFALDTPALGREGGDPPGAPGIEPEPGMVP
jgi:MFS transporter, PPP family, 3-phenylpropionic acid transporter